jgi:polar amino acid transport system substrate-binding protein
MTNRSRWERDVAFTRPYATTRTVVGAPPGRELSGDLGGVRVRAELGSEAEALVDAKTDAEVVTVTSLASSRGLPTAAEEYVLDDLGLRPSEVVLKEDKHVMAVRFGENAWLVRLERFLQRREGQIARRIVELGRP